MFTRPDEPPSRVAGPPRSARRPTGSSRSAGEVREATAQLRRPLARRSSHVERRGEKASALSYDRQTGRRASGFEQRTVKCATLFGVRHEYKMDGSIRPAHRRVQRSSAESQAADSTHDFNIAKVAFNISFLTPANPAFKQDSYAMS